MMGWFKKLFERPSTAAFLVKRPIVLDVRSASEYKAGHIAGSRHIPLDQLRKKMEEIRKWNRPVLTCCASGRRSGIAASQLKAAGVEAMNGGGWRHLQRIIETYKQQA